MTRWILLLLTLACAFMLYDTLRWLGAIPKTPFKTISAFWRGDANHLSLTEQDKRRKQFASAVSSRIVHLFFWCTAMLGYFTVKAFLE